MSSQLFDKSEKSIEGQVFETPVTDSGLLLFLL